MGKISFKNVALLILLVAIVSGCAGIGDTYKANEDLFIVTDWNSLSALKPTCLIHTGDIVTVMDTTTIAGELAYEISDGAGCDGYIGAFSKFTKQK